MKEQSATLNAITGLTLHFYTPSFNQGRRTFVRRSIAVPDVSK